MSIFNSVAGSAFTTKSSRSQMFFKISVFKILQISREFHLVFSKSYGKPPFVDSVQPYQKEATGQVFSRECFEFSKNTYFVEHLRTAALALIAHDHATLSWSKKVWKQPL